MKNRDTLLHSMPLGKSARNVPEILLVEDDDADAKAVTRALNKAGLANRVHRAVDGVEALELLRGKTSEFLDHCILLADVNMPRMNGHELLDELRADPTLCRAVVFVMTTSSDQRDIDAAYDRNVAGYILKARIGSDYKSFANTLDSYGRIFELPHLNMRGTV